MLKLQQVFKVVIAFVFSSPDMYQRLLKPLLFLFQPETAHHIVFFLLESIGRIPGGRWLIRKLNRPIQPKEAVTVAGLRFPNRIGLAAGFDKNAKVFRELGALGFGFVEIGTVTPVAQAGNPKPRLFRLPADNALINRMGFNNDGLAAIVQRLKVDHPGILIGGNIGKNKATPNERADEDYGICFNALFEVVDYFVVNVSSPNTPGLRALQEKKPLQEILNKLQVFNNLKASKLKITKRPIFLKIAPDLTNEQLDDVVEVILETGCAGVIATNTTILRSGLKSDNQKVLEMGAGGLSGKPLTDRSTAVIRYLHTKSDGQFAIIGVGGIHSAQDALEKLSAGASLVQLYTGFVYEGPRLVTQIRKAIIR